MPSRAPGILVRVTNRAASILRPTALVGAALLASGCSVFSPVQTDRPYIPGDGVGLTISGLDLRNLAIVSDGKGAPGVLVGQAVNRGPESVDVVFAVQGSAGTRTAVPAHSGAALSDADSTVELGSVPVAPGAMVQLTVATEEAGQNVVLVPVLPREQYYADLPEPGAGG